MELSIKSIILFSSIFLTGLSAGLWYAWQVSVIPGTLKTSASVYLQTMQSINRAILNPAFFVIFFGGAVLLIISAFQHFGQGPKFWLLLTSGLIYFIGTIMVTGRGNVPLNNELEVLNLSEMTVKQLTDFRAHYEIKWNRYHLVRTVFALISFGLAMLTLFFPTKH